jgi:mono/diheme cytochrome c family protein
MKRRRLLAVALLPLVLLILGGCDTVSGDSVRGAELHKDCVGCHATELYRPPKAKVKTLDALKAETERWNDRMNPKFTEQEVEDLVAYLNSNFYKFPRN